MTADLVRIEQKLDLIIDALGLGQRQRIIRHPAHTAHRLSKAGCGPSSIG